MKNYLKKKESWYELSKFERNGIIVLCSIVLLLIAINVIIKNTSLFTQNNKDYTSNFTQLQNQINNASFINTQKYSNTNDTKIFNKEQNTYTKNNPNLKNTTYKNYTTKLIIEVNSATQEDYEKLYGIGKVYAERIIKFRDKLGGFYSTNQIKDVFGIEDSIYQKFEKNLTIKPIKVKKININEATYEELTANPYFFSTIAKQIIGYRTKVKPFTNTEDLKKLYFIKDNPAHYNKILPYVVIN